MSTDLKALLHEQQLQHRQALEDEKLQQRQCIAEAKALLSQVEGLSHGKYVSPERAWAMHAKLAISIPKLEAIRTRRKELESSIGLLHYAAHQPQPAVELTDG